MYLYQWLHNAALALALATGAPVLPPDEAEKQTNRQARPALAPANDQAQAGIRLRAAD